MPDFLLSFANKGDLYYIIVTANPIYVVLNLFISLYLCISVSQYLYISVSLSLYLYISVSLSLYLSISLSLYLHISISNHPSPTSDLLLCLWISTYLTYTNIPPYSTAYPIDTPPVHTLFYIYIFISISISNPTGTHSSCRKSRTEAEAWAVWWTFGGGPEGCPGGPRRGHTRVREYVGVMFRCLDV